MSADARSPSVTVRRTIAASAEEPFDAWLDPAAAAEWMRPVGIVRTRAQIDPRPGGAFEIVMEHATEGEIVHTGVDQTIERPRRLVFTWRSPATRQTDSLVTVEFHERGESTEVVVLHERLPDEGARPSHVEGWTSALERLSKRASARAS